MAAAYATFAIYYLLVKPQPLQSGATQVQMNLLPLSAPLAVAYVFWATRSIMLAAPLHNIRIARRTIAPAALVIAAYLLLSHVMSSFAGTASPMGLGSLARGIVVTSLVYPGAFVVAHVMFYGPWAVAFMSFLPLIWADSAKRASPLLPILFLTTVFFLLTESRGITFYVPFAIFLLCQTVNAFISTRTAVLFVGTAFLFSHFWLPMPQMPFGNLLVAPAQRMFMHIGPWMGMEAYVIGLLQALAASMVVIQLHNDRRIAQSVAGVSSSRIRPPLRRGSAG